MCCGRITLYQYIKVDTVTNECCYNAGPTPKARVMTTFEQHLFVCTLLDHTLGVALSMFVLVSFTISNVPQICFTLPNTTKHFLNNFCWVFQKFDHLAINTIPASHLLRYVTSLFNNSNISFWSF